MTSAHREVPGWVAPARTLARRPPAVPRLPFAVAGQTVGSVAPGVLEGVALEGGALTKEPHAGAWRWHLACAPADATPALAALAEALRSAGRCGAWRDEQLAVCNAAGERVGTVERGAVRALGIATRAVHLVACVPDGRQWVQQRAFTKPSHPGRWDTLMGGMVSAQDTVASALARETWEEAGLRIEALQAVAQGGHVDFARPSDEGEGAGYMVERIDWFRATVPDGLVPANQDGEVERFELLDEAAVHARLAQGAFTPEAALVLACFYGW
ncbi:NUDIX hydrolase [Acidovorax sacchari]|uniref:NUDIX hydrolase n=1 Tax=Acidovorax sacchari TaxID=3230736 RepID=UPI0039E36C3E